MASRQTKKTTQTKKKTSTSGNKNSNSRQTSKTTTSANKGKKGSQRTSTKEVTSKGKSQEQIREEGIVQDEIILVIALVVAALLFISNIGIGGKVGNLVSGFLFGLMGFMAYLFPFALFFGTAFHISNYGNRSAKQKLISSIILVIAFTGLMQLISTPGGEYTLVEYYKDSMETKTGGGFIGGMLVKLLYNGFGLAGSYIILIAIILISITILSQKAILTHLAKESKNSLNERREYQKIRREQAETEDELYAQEIIERKPPKTFIIDPEMALVAGKQSTKTKVGDKLSQKEKKINKELEKIQEKEEPLPVINLDHLFPPQKKEEDQVSTVHTYEDELRSKFGKPTVDIDFAKEPSYETDVKAVNDSLEEDYDMGVLNGSTYVEDDYFIPSNEKFIDDISSDKQNIWDEEANESNKANLQPSMDSDHLDKRNLEQPYETGNNLNQTDRDVNKKKDVVQDDTPIESLKIEQTVEKKEYRFPSLDLLSPPKAKANKGNSNENHLKETAIKLQTTLESFGVHVTITNVSCGPTVTRYELQPEQGVKVKSITSLADDIKLSLAAAEVRIEAPIPGKSAVGIEVPNKENSMVTLREILESSDFVKHPSDIAFSVGKDIGGQTIVTDIAKMPHLLIAGATGSGKSVCINTLIMSILYKANPADVRLIMIDPKVVELSVYNGIPHLLIPVVTDPKKASAALNWAVVEMTERYKKFAEYNVRDLKGYNEKIKEVEHLNDSTLQKLPQIVIIIDELADLMMVAPGEVEDAICRLAQLARAAGIHLVIATQRPSVNVITGLIKANVPSRIAFAVSSAIDSRTILDGGGAEKLLGRGDMLFFPSGYPKPVRVQGAFVSDKEVGAVVDFLKNNNQETTYNEEVNEKISNARIGDGAGSAGGGNDRDDYFIEAGKFIIEKDKASIGMLQRVYKIGFNRAARIMDQLAEAGVVGPEEGTKPRKVLMSIEDFENYLEENG